MEGILLKTLEQQVVPRHTALIVVDPQRDYCASDGALARVLGVDVSNIQAAVPVLNRFIEEARRRGVFVVWLRAVHPVNRLRPSHKAMYLPGDPIWIVPEGGEGAEWYDAVVKPLAGEPVVTKYHYDGFEDTDLDLLLHTREIKTLLMTGFATNVCVETTARHGYIKGYHIVLVSDCTHASTVGEYEAALHNVRLYFGKVATSDEIIGVWDAQPVEDNGKK